MNPTWQQIRERPDILKRQYVLLSRWIQLTWLVVVVLLSCDSPTESTLLPIYDIPRIPGIVRMSADNDYYGVIGNPVVPEDPFNQFAVSHIYPNPFNGQARVDITLGIEGNVPVRVWFTKGVGQGDYEPPQVQSNAGLQAWVVQAFPRKTLLDTILAVTFTPPTEGVVVSKYYHMSLQLRLPKEEYPDGYYRLYIQAYGRTIWRDFFSLHDVSCANLRRFNLESSFCP